MADEWTDEEIDEFALEVERSIADGRDFIDRMPDFEEGAKIRGASTVRNVEEILGDYATPPSS